MTKMFEADRHNFGKCVERIERASGTWYRKPRSIYWEHLFFGKQSPMVPIFDFMGPNGNRKLASHLFNLDVESENDWLGYAREVNISQAPISLDHFYSLGILIGYCYLFGIRDLHKYNLVIQENHLQIIDAEVVLTNLILPNETILLPFREIPFELSALSLLCTYLKGLDDAQVQAVLSGYFDICTAVLDNLDLIHAVLGHEDLCHHPARVILKNTRQYRDFLLGSGSSRDFVPEELAQLERGDIPYFFKYVGQNDLWYLSSSTAAKAVAALPSDLQRDVDRHIRAPVLLLTSAASIVKKIATGALYLRKVFGKTGPFQVEDKDGHISFSASSLSFRNYSFSAQSRSI